MCVSGECGFDSHHLVAVAFFFSFFSSSSTTSEEKNTRAAGDGGACETLLRSSRTVQVGVQISPRRSVGFVIGLVHGALPNDPGRGGPPFVLVSPFATVKVCISRVDTSTRIKISRTRKAVEPRSSNGPNTDDSFFFPFCFLDIDDDASTGLITSTTRYCQWRTWFSRKESLRRIRETSAPWCRSSAR